MSFGENRYTFLLGIQLQGQKICIYSALVDTAKELSKLSVQIYTPIACIIILVDAYQH